MDNQNIVAHFLVCRTLSLALGAGCNLRVKPEPSGPLILHVSRTLWGDHVASLVAAARCVGPRCHLVGTVIPFARRSEPMEDWTGFSAYVFVNMSSRKTTGSLREPCCSLARGFAAIKINVYAKFR